MRAGAGGGGGGPSRTWWERTQATPASSSPTSRRVRPLRDAPDLLGRPRRPRRRPPEVGERPRLPLVGVGIFYREGFFRQTLERRGRQKESYPRSTRRRPGLELEPVAVEVELAGETVTRRIWRARVGDAPPLPARRRSVTDALYGGDRDIGSGRRSCSASAACAPSSALGLEADRLPHERGPRGVPRPRAHPRAASRRAGSPSPRRASSRARRPSSRRTRPCPPGTTSSRRAHAQLLRGHARGLRHRAATSSSGSAAQSRRTDELRDAPLGLRSRPRVNGVSRAARPRVAALWRGVFPDAPSPRSRSAQSRTASTRRTWLGSASCDARAEATRRRPSPTSSAAARAPPRGAASSGAPPGGARPATARRLDGDAEAARQRPRPDGAHDRLRAALRDVQARDPHLPGSRAPRAAPRGPDRPVQLLFAGKAHPRDDAGQGAHRSESASSPRDPRVPRPRRLRRGLRHAARARLVQGVDVWLNNPRRPLEASGRAA